MKSKLVSVALSAILVFSSLAVPVSAQDANLDALRQQIQMLLAQVAALQAQLAVLSGQQPAATCPNITYNLYLGLGDGTTEGQVSMLQKFLASDSSIYPEASITGYFGPLTEQAVQRFQRKHNIVSSGSPDTTGYGVVGRATRAKIREMCGATLSPLPMPSITVLSPNGGETFQIGKTFTITWQQASNTSVSISLENDKLPGTGDSLIYRKDIGEVSGTSGKNVYSWTLPTDIPAAAGYRISIGGYFNVGAERPALSGDTSDTPFTIISSSTTNPSPVVALLSPNGGERWMVGSKYRITWDGRNFPANSYVGIALVDKKTTNTYLFSDWNQPSTINDGVEEWAIPANVTPGLYKIRIWCGIKDTERYCSPDGTRNSSVEDYSNYEFEISAAPAASIKILYPNGGETLRQGDLHTLRWEPPAGVSHVNLGIQEQVPAGTGYENAYTVIAENISNSGSYYWTASVYLGNTAQIKPGSYKLRVTAVVGDKVILDDSDRPFNIISAAAPSISVLSPNGGEIWQVGSDAQNKTPQKISWNSSGFTPNARLYLYFLEQDSYGNWTPANKLTNGIGSFLPSVSNEFTIYPDLVHVGNKKIRISNNPNEINMLCMDFNIAPDPNTNCPIPPGTQYVYDDSNAPFSIASLDTTPPSIPTNFNFTVYNTTSHGLSWSASTDNVGVAGYRLERCMGANCVDFSQIAAPTTTSYTDSGLTANTTYKYRVRAADAAGNLSGYSSIITRIHL